MANFLVKSHLPVPFLSTLRKDVLPNKPLLSPFETNSTEQKPNGNNSSIMIWVLIGNAKPLCVISIKIALNDTFHFYQITKQLED